MPALVTTGYSGACATPMAKRTTISRPSVTATDIAGTRQVIRLRTPHASMISVRLRRAPIRPPTTPPGNWKMP